MSQLEKNANAIVEDAKSAAANLADTAKSAAHKVADTVKDAAADATDTVKQTAQSVRRTASEAVDQSGRQMRYADDDEELPFIDNLSNRAQDLAERSMDFWADSSDRARRQFQATADATTRYVTEQPGRSVLIAAATGAALATAFFLGRSRKK